MRLVAYDVMDKVHVAVSFRDSTDDSLPDRSWDSVLVTAIQGCGETDRRAWVSDALIAALEVL